MSEKPLSNRNVTLPDSCWDWIDAYAKNKGMSPDDYLAYVINYFRADISTHNRIARLEADLASARRQLDAARKVFPVARNPGRGDPQRPLRPDIYKV